MILRQQTKIRMQGSKTEASKIQTTNQTHKEARRRIKRIRKRTRSDLCGAIDLFFNIME